MKRTAREIANTSYSWDDESWNGLHSALMQAVYLELTVLNNQLRSLGSDGIHTLIRLGLTEVRATKRKRLAAEMRRKKARG